MVLGDGLRNFVFDCCAPDAVNVNQIREQARFWQADPPTLQASPTDRKRDVRPPLTQGEGEPPRGGRARKTLGEGEKGVCRERSERERVREGEGRGVRVRTGRTEHHQIHL